MTPENIRDVAQIVHQFGHGKLANELNQLADRYQWRPISEIHEDYGDCVLMNIDDPGYLEIGSNLNLDWDESKWTHFSRIVPLTTEEAERLKAQMIETGPCNDCGLPCPKGDELCGACYEEQRLAEEWEKMHPEARCPPRE